MEQFDESGGTVPNFEFLMNFAKMLSESSEEDIKETKRPALHFDEQIQDRRMKAIKAAIPYFEPSVGQRVGIMIKMLEIRNILNNYDDIEIKCAPFYRTSNILAAMSPFCDERAVRTADMISKMMTFKNIYDLSKGMGVESNE